MSAETVAKVGSSVIPLAAGLYFFLLSVRWVGKPPGLDLAYDERHARRKGLFRYGGLLLMAFGLSFILAALYQEYRSRRPPADADWRTVLSADGGCSAEMPGTPKPKEREATGAFGRVVTHLQHLEAAGGRCDYSLGYSDVPAGKGRLPDEEVLDQPDTRGRAGALPGGKAASGRRLGG